MNKLHTAPTDAVSIWGLHEASRFPVTPEDWEKYHPLPPVPPMRLWGDKPFDLFVNPDGRMPTRNTFRDLVLSHMDLFDAASCAFRSHEWRTLYHLDLYPLAVLGNPSFDAKQAIREILDQDSSLTDVPQEWTGSPDRTSNVLLDIHVTLADLEPDKVKAVWTILSFARSLGLEKNEVLQIPWWSSWWFQSYIVCFD